MPTVEKTHGGQVYIRSVGTRFSIGDRAEVSDDEAVYLTEKRGDFATVEEEDDSDVDEAADADTLVGSFDPSDHTVDEVADHVESINGSDIVAELEAIRQAEADGKDRSTALEAIDARLDDLED